MSLRVLSVTGPAWVQDLGRPGHMHEGMPWGGAMVPELAAATNAAVGNPLHFPMIEFYGVLSCESNKAIAVDGLLVEGAARRSIRVGAGQRVSCLAIAGGVHVPRFMGGYGTLPTAGLGGFHGRSLRAGDVLQTGQQHGRLKPIAGRSVRGGIRKPDWGAVVEVRTGPEWEDFSAQSQGQFLNGIWRAAEPSDRTGIRLSGTPLQDSPLLKASRPMVRGAVQVPPNGLPVVMGPDHPVTGGYPVIAVVEPQSLGSVCGRASGREIRFILSGV